LESAGTVAGRFLGAGTVAARLLHPPPPLAALGFTRRRENNRETGGVVTASSPLPFPSGGEEICHLQQKENAQTAMGSVF